MKIRVLPVFFSITQLKSTNTIKVYSKRQQFIFDEFWKQIDSANYTKSLNQIPDGLFETLEVRGEDSEIKVGRIFIFLVRQSIAFNHN